MKSTLCSHVGKILESMVDGNWKEFDDIALAYVRGYIPLSCSVARNLLEYLYTKRRLKE